MSDDQIPPFRYTAALAADIERTWQDYWETNGTFEVANPAGDLADGDGRPLGHKLYVLDMFPYPSGAGLHVGHPLGYIATDVLGRFRRMVGDSVLHTLGYDSFGLPAEQYAIRTGTHPAVTTQANVDNMRRQLRRLGLAHDQRRSVSTTDEAFYRWTQWIFLQIFNAWYDADAGKARPIAELIDEFAAGTRSTPDGTEWASLGEPERRALVDSHRLAYVAESPVNWCPGMGTTLANEEVTAEGLSDIGNYPVFKRNMAQWTMRITAYADRLLADLDRVDWPESVKLMQRNWIGRSEGAFVDFGSEAGAIRVFTTRADTLFGATFLVLSPEHPMVDALTSPEAAADVARYREASAAKTDRDRQADAKVKTGVALGSVAVNPANGEAIPVWIADYVLMGYGTGAIMAVPSGDERDFEFARQFDLPIVATQMPPESWFAGHGIAASTDTATWPEGFIGEGTYVNSANDAVRLDGDRSVAEAKALMHAWLADSGHGEATVTYRLRDWLFSRQRYWGEPFPIVWDDNGPVALPETALPVRLPELTDFAPEALDPNDAASQPRPPLARADDWTEVTLDLGDGERTYRRELNVMPQWAGSCWYEMRYLDPTNSDRFIDPEVERFWMGPDPTRPGDPGGVDLYVGGVEHAVLHLLYSRFWHKVLYDLGHVSSEEPFRRLFNQGYIQAYAYRDERGQYVEAAEVEEAADGTYLFDGKPVAREYGKMGKSLKNVVTPDEMYDAYGADTLRLFEMSMGPLDSSRPWSTRDVVGMHRFIQRVWRNLIDEESGECVVAGADTPVADDTLTLLHRTIDGVRRDLAEMRNNTAIAKLIELNNHLTQLSGPVPRAVAEPMVVMLAPFCPHVAEELWRRLGHADTIAYVAFPEADPALLVADTVEVPVQVNGKVRSRLTVPADAPADEVERLALADEKIAAILDGAAPRRVIVVPNKMVNIVK